MKNVTYLNAGAGSGKTYYLTDTYASHVKNNECTPSEVILTTFSEKAAADIKRNARIRFLQKQMHDKAPLIDAANIGTVHSVAYKYIKKYWYLIGVGAQCEVLTDENKSEYIAMTLGENATPEDLSAFREYAECVNLQIQQSTRYDYDFWKGAVTGIIEKADSMGVDNLDESLSKSLDLVNTCFGGEKPEDEVYSRTTDCTKRIFRIASQWRSKFASFKKENSLIEYNDMENYFLEMLEMPKYRIVQDEIRESIKYVFVDEFQDSNPKQLRIFDLLSELVVHSYWVGDLKQAIYGFRECDTELVQALTNRIKQYEELKVPGFKIDSKTLRTSRRSLKPLVDFTNKVFVKVFPDLSTNDIVLQSDFRDEEFSEQVPLLQHWDGELKEGTSPDKQSALNGLISEIKRILDGKSQIKKVFDKETREERMVRASDIAILCRTNTDVDNVAQTLRTYHIPVTTDRVAGASKIEIKLILLILNRMACSEPLLDAELSKIYFGVTLSDIIGKDISEIRQIASELEKYWKPLSGRGISTIVRGLIMRMNLLDRCARWGNGEERKANLMALISSACEYEQTCLGMGMSATIEGFITKIETEGVGVSGYTSEGVNVVTYHGSKGLQWPVVVMYSLHNDLLDTKHIEKSYLWDVRAVRKDKPKADNLYPGYYITYTTPRTRQYNAKIPDKYKAGISTTSGFQEMAAAEIREGRRLLYVGVTRARDILIEFGQCAKIMKVLKNTLGDFDDRWDARTGKCWEDESIQEVWGKGFPMFYYRRIVAEDPPKDIDDDKYSCLPDISPDTTSDPKRMSPSSIEDKKLVSSVKVVCKSEGKFSQLIAKPADAPENEIGTCIHNIFAVYANGTDITSIIARHGLSGMLDNTDAIVKSIEILYNFLESSFGKAVLIEHELPFRRITEGQMISGSIDLVWYTTQKECVLVDFKNLADASDDVLNPTNQRYLGNYAPQQKAYMEALIESGLNVRASLLYLPMQGEIIELQGL